MIGTVSNGNPSAVKKELIYVNHIGGVPQFMETARYRITINGKSVLLNRPPTPPGGQK